MFDKAENFIKRNKFEKYFTKKYLDYFLLALALLIGIYLDLGIKEIAAGLFALFLLLNPIKSELAAKAALFFLALTPIALIFGRDAKAEKLAIVAYGFLVLTVILAIWELKANKPSRKNTKNSIN